MKLSPAQIDLAVDQLQISAISEAPELLDQLADMYGDHTFFIDADGLHIFERLDEDQEGSDGDTLSLIQLAAWADDARTEVTTHEPQNTGKTLQLVADPLIH